MAKRSLILIALITLGALAAAGQAAAPAQSPLEGHQIGAQMPQGILVVTDDRIGWTWSGPLLLTIDGKPAARIELGTSSVALPARSWGFKEYAAAVAVALIAGGLGFEIGHGIP